MFGTCHQNLIVTGLAIRDSNHGLKKKKNCPHLGIAIKTGDIFKDKNGCLLVNSVELRPITSPSEGFESNFTSSFKEGAITIAFNIIQRHILKINLLGFKPILPHYACK